MTLPPDPIEGAYSAPADALVIASALGVFSHFCPTPSAVETSYAHAGLFQWNFPTRLNLGFTLSQRNISVHRQAAAGTTQWRHILLGAVNNIVTHK